QRRRIHAQGQRVDRATDGATVPDQRAGAVDLREEAGGRPVDLGEVTADVDAVGSDGERAHRCVRGGRPGGDRARGVDLGEVGPGLTSDAGEVTAEVVATGSVR